MNYFGETQAVLSFAEKREGERGIREERGSSKNLASTTFTSQKKKGMPHLAVEFLNNSTRLSNLNLVILTPVGRAVGHPFSLFHKIVYLLQSCLEDLAHQACFSANGLVKIRMHVILTLELMPPSLLLISRNRGRE